MEKNRVKIDNGNISKAMVKPETIGALAFVTLAILLATFSHVNEAKETDGCRNSLCYKPTTPWYEWNSYYLASQLHTTLEMRLTLFASEEEGHRSVHRGLRLAHVAGMDIQFLSSTSLFLFLLLFLLVRVLC